MKHYSHIAAAILFFLIFAYLFNIKNVDLLAGILLTSIVSVLPDLIDMIIDTKHRGIGHSLLLWIPVILLIGVISIINGNVVILIAVVTAIISHIILDLVTRHGYPLFYPKKITFVALNSKKRIETGTKQDKAVFVFLILMLIPAVVFSFDIINLPPQAVGAPESTNNTTNDQPTIKDNVNVNIDSNMKNTNITIKKISESETQILIQDI
ncbi:MAG: metal-dependent hydrolase [Methanobacterium sp.]